MATKTFRSNNTNHSSNGWDNDDRNEYAEKKRLWMTGAISNKQFYNRTYKVKDSADEWIENHS